MSAEVVKALCSPCMESSSAHLCYQSIQHNPPLMTKIRSRTRGLRYWRLSSLLTTSRQNNQYMLEGKKALQKTKTK